MVIQCSKTNLILCTSLCLFNSLIKSHKMVQVEICYIFCSQCDSKFLCWPLLLCDHRLYNLTNTHFILIYSDFWLILLNYADYAFDVKEPEFTALSKKAKGKTVWNNNSWLLIFDKLFYFIEYMSFSITPEKEAWINLRINTCTGILRVILEIILHFVVELVLFWFTQEKKLTKYQCWI